VNREHVARLIKEKRMQPTGHAEIKRAKADGRWDAAYDSPKNMKPPAEFLKALAAHKKAAAFFKTLNKASVYSIAWRVREAKKSDTKERRIKEFIAMLARGDSALIPQKGWAKKGLK
jgi:uncharacterized protein YdeI (YjbR/CyaY-like superfamily)